jgi:hypothetical protein
MQSEQKFPRTSGTVASDIAKTLNYGDLSMKCRLVLLAAGSVILCCAGSCSSEKNGVAGNAKGADGITADSMAPTKTDTINATLIVDSMIPVTNRASCADVVFEFKTFNGAYPYNDDTPPVVRVAIHPQKDGRFQGNGCSATVRASVPKGLYVVYFLDGNFQSENGKWPVGSYAFCSGYPEFGGGTNREVSLPDAPVLIAGTERGLTFMYHYTGGGCTWTTG